MTRDWNRSPHEPTPDQLAAYFDGGLTGHARDAVEAWLADQPDARAASFTDYDDDLSRAWQRTQPADPGRDAWAGVLGRIGAAVPAPVGEPLRRRPTPWKLFGMAVAAAAVVGIVLIGRALWPTPARTPKIAPPSDDRQARMEPEEEDDDRTQVPFALAAPADVRVICMQGDDTHLDIEGQLVKTLVVGEPPVADELLLPTSYERTRLLGWIDPALRFEEWSVPIIIDPEVPTKNK